MTLYDWNLLKPEAADRIWQDWNALETKLQPEAYLADAAAALAAEQQLPGLESSLWLAVTAEGERYILAAPMCFGPFARRKICADRYKKQDLLIGLDKPIP